MIRTLKSGEYRLYSRQKGPKKGKRPNLDTFKTLEEPETHERAVQYPKRKRHVSALTPLAGAAEPSIFFTLKLRG
jgi:hypothetical protein